ncbi:MAG: hypothetical protein R3F11_28140 [Verrucomicrobiales bacterium]
MKEPNPQNKKAVRRLILAIALLFAGAVAAYFLVDESPGDYSDLEITIQPVPDEENGVVVMRKLGDALDWLDDPITAPIQNDEWETYSDAVRGLMPPSADWEKAVAADILAKAKPAFTLMDEALAKPSWLADPAPTSSDASGLFIQLTDLSRLKRIEAKALAHAGDRREALRPVEGSLELAMLLSESPCNFLGQLVATVDYSIAITTLHELLAATECNADETRDLARRLITYRIAEGALGRSLQVEFQCMKESMLDPSIAMSGSDRDSWLGRFFYKPNATRNLYALLYSEQRRNYSLPIAHRATPSFDQLREGLRHPVFKFLESNISGREAALHSIDLAMFHVSDNWLAARQRFELLIALAAIKEWQAAHGGELPDSLSDLVPGIIDAVPTDFFSGEPVRYSKADALIWSVGTDGIDDGGDPSVVGFDNKGELSLLIFSSKAQELDLDP